MTPDGKPENGDIFIASAGPFIVIVDKTTNLVGMWIGVESYGQSRITIDNLVRNSKYFDKLKSLDLLEYILENKDAC